MKLIVAVDKNWAIGNRNQLLVSIPEDMRFFRRETTNKVIIMGKNTLESFPNGQPLKDRTNIVITSKRDYKVNGAEVVHSIEEALKTLEKFNTDDVYVIGGGSIYKQLLPYCETAYITKIDFAYEADTYFPNLDQFTEWKEEEVSEEQTYFDIEYTFCKYVRA